MKAMLTIFVLLNGQAIQFPDAVPVQEDGRILIPLRGVFEAMGAKVEYDPTVRGIQIQQESGKEKNKIEMSVGRRHAWVNGYEHSLDVPVRLQENRVMVPIRFVAEALGAEVDWNRVTNTVNINTDAPAKRELPRPSVRAGKIEVVAQTAQKSYGVGEKIKVSATAQNRSEQPVEITYGSGQSFDAIITPVGKTSPRWDWSHGRMFTMALRHKTLAPNEKLEFSLEWDQKDNDKKPVPPGEYSVVVRLTANGGIEAKPVRFTIRD